MGLDLLESLVDRLRLLNLLVHLLTHESVPQLIDVQVVAHLELGGVFAFVSGSFSNLLVFLLALDAALHRLLFVGNASLELNDTLLTVALLFLDILHEAVEDVLRLELFLLSLAGLSLLAVENLTLVPQRGFKVVGLQLAGNEVFVHTLEHVQVSAASHLLLVDLVVGILKALGQLGQALFVIGNRSLDLSLLDFNSSNLLADAVVFLLLEGDELFGFIVLLFDLRKLRRHLVDLLLVVLKSSSVVGGFEKGVLLDEGVRTVVDLEFLLHDRAARARELLGACTALASVTVHLNQ